MSKNRRLTPAAERRVRNAFIGFGEVALALALVLVLAFAAGTGWREEKRLAGPESPREFTAAGKFDNQLRSGQSAHVDLPGDGGGDQRGPAFLQQVNGALGFGGEGVESVPLID